MSILNDGQKDTLEKNGEVDFSYIVPGISRFRVNAYKQRGSYGIAFRVISIKIPTLDDLGFPEILKTLAMKPRGLVLVTGPTGSGKSTTLAAMVHHINSNRKCHILTLEEPIEYLHTHRSSMVNQREVGGDTQSFHSGLRAALREDPDVIVIGEMRDLETISTAITAAETGHLVMSTLHTTGAEQTIDRIIDVFPPFQQQQVRVQLSAVLEGVISQQLIARHDRPGMIAVQEILIATNAVRNIIRDGKTNQVQTIIQTSSKLGMRSMDLSLAETVRRGVITRSRRSATRSTATSSRSTSPESSPPIQGKERRHAGIQVQSHQQGRGILAGTITVASQSDVVQMLREKEYLPVSVEAVRGSQEISIGFLTKIKVKDIAIFCRQFHTMLNSGISIIQCLDILRQQFDNLKLRAVIADVYELVQKGSALSEAMRAHRDAFRNCSSTWSRRANFPQPGHHPAAHGGPL
jgi:twitching motility protein PilT